MRSAPSKFAMPAGSGSTGSIRHALKPIHDWVANLKQLWSERFAALDDVLEELKAEGGSTMVPETEWQEGSPDAAE